LCGYRQQTLTQVIDFDVLGVNEIRTRTINLTNSNPVKVDINWMETNVEGLVIKLDSVWNSHGYATSGRLVEANKQKLATDNRAYAFDQQLAFSLLSLSVLW
jgi:hypothetical protein